MSTKEGSVEDSSIESKSSGAVNEAYLAGRPFGPCRDVGIVHNEGWNPKHAALIGFGSHFTEPIPMLIRPAIRCRQLIFDSVVCSGVDVVLHKMGTNFGTGEMILSLAHA